MNRELKFRVWDNDKKQFEYFELHNITVPDRLLCQHNYPVQQWTGFIDRHGKDIYEGDFLGKKFEAIEFHNGKFKVSLKGARNFDLEEFFDEYTKPEITGNIFEKQIND